MTRFTTFALLLVLLCLTCACNDGSNEGATATSPVSTSEPAIADASPATAPSSAPVYPSIALDRLEYLFDNATYMDATFYNLPISVNQSKLDQIRATLSGIAAEPMVINPDCQPAGHVWFQVNGKNVEEADLYFQQGCTGYVWYDNGKPAYSNALTQQGINFYQNIINSVQEQTGGGQ